MRVLLYPKLSSEHGHTRRTVGAIRGRLLLPLTGCRLESHENSVIAAIRWINACGLSKTPILLSLSRNLGVSRVLDKSQANGWIQDRLR
jgi:hypothetical protein